MNTQELMEVMKQQAELAATAATEKSQQAASAVNEAVSSGYKQTSTLIKQHPMEALAICVGVGLVAGIVVGLSAMSQRSAA